MRVATIRLLMLAILAQPAHAVLQAQAVVVRLYGDDKGYRAEPSTITLPVGGSVQFVLVSGGPHNVTFEEDTLPAGVLDRLAANMPDGLSRLSSPMLLAAGDSYTISFAGLPAGTYRFHCSPHYAMNERGVIEVTGPGVSTETAAIQQAETRIAEAATITRVRSLLRNLVAAQEAYFTDSSRYTDRVADLQREVGTVPSDVKLSITLPAPGSWQAVAIFPAAVCAIAISTANPLSADATDGETVCVTAAKAK